MATIFLKESDYSVFAVEVNTRIYFGVAKSAEDAKKYIDSLSLYDFFNMFPSSIYSFTVFEVSRTAVKLSFHPSGTPELYFLDSAGSCRTECFPKFFLKD